MHRADTQLKIGLRSVDLEILSTDEKKALQSIKRLSTEVRLDIRDYELSETREEQIKCSVIARQRLAKLQANIIQASSVFSPADVAQLSAQLEQINEWLE